VGAKSGPESTRSGAGCYHVAPSSPLLVVGLSWVVVPRIRVRVRFVVVVLVVLQPRPAAIRPRQVEPWPHSSVAGSR
jgi:hypothetical protein